MTRKDFQLIAEVVILTSEIFDDQTADTIAELFADRLAGTNPNFDRERFLKACKGGN